MKKVITVVAAVAATAALAGATAGVAGADTTVLRGYTCVVGTPGGTFTTTNSITVESSNGLVVSHCTFFDTGYGGSYPFQCMVGPGNTEPADVSQQHYGGGNISQTCVLVPTG